MKKGTVRWFNADKGYGFIIPDDDTENDVFVHYKSIQGAGYKKLNDGQRVSFETQIGNKGLQAINVVAE